jgi:hypothetical protein
LDYNRIGLLLIAIIFTPDNALKKCDELVDPLRFKLVKVQAIPC